MLLVESIKWILYKLWNSSRYTKLVVLAIIIFTVHILYSTKINYGDTLEKYGGNRKTFTVGVGTLVKVLQSYTTPKEFYKLYLVKRREKKEEDNTQTLRFGVLLRLFVS